MKAHTLLAVALGGLIGGFSRAMTVSKFGSPSFEIAILVINLVGCALVAFFMGYVRRRFSETRWNELIRPFFVTGILGGFTTVSAFAVNTLFLTQDHRLYGLLYGIASIYGGFFIYGFVFKKVSA